MLQRAREFLQKGLLKDADLTVREYLDKHSNSADGHFLLGYILFKEQKAEASLAEYTEGAKYHDPYPSDLKIVALDYVLLKVSKGHADSFSVNKRPCEKWAGQITGFDPTSLFDPSVPPCAFWVFSRM